MGDPFAVNYRDLARRLAVKYGIDPAIFVRQIDQESGFQTDQTSSAGAEGIAQIVPQFHPEVDPTDPVASLDWAARADAQALKKYGGRWDLALAEYNAGAGAVAQYGGVPPYPETQSYVTSILGGAAADPSPPPPSGPPVSSRQLYLVLAAAVAFFVLVVV